MIQVVNKEKCSGCSACAQICPKQCITMVSDDEGFLYPKVQLDKCSRCNLCESICPVSNHPKYSDAVVASFAGYARDENIRLYSSSGGIFSIFAKAILDMQGVVFGATLDDEHVCHHIFIECVSDLYKLQGSKYVQSSIEDCYLKVKDYLQKGRKVLFSGTACQCAGLKAFLRKEYENLFLIDILCHGVPSPKVWERYLHSMEKKYGASISKINFRTKKFGWKDWAIKLIFNDNREYEKKKSEDSFINLFLSNISLRPSCYNCEFKKLERPSDVTLGDAWGIERTMPCLDDDKGTSAIIVHTEKGMKIFKYIQKSLIFNEIDIDMLLPPYADSRKSVMPHPNRKKFFRRLNQGASWEDLYKVNKLTLYDRVVNKMRRVGRKIITKKI